MANVTTAPVLVTPEAAEFVARLGYQSELDRIVEHALEVFPDVRLIHVAFEDSPDDAPGVVLWTYVNDLPGSFEIHKNEWKPWYITMIPDGVRYNITLITVDGAVLNGR